MSKILLKNISHEKKVSQNNKAYVSCKLTVWNKEQGKDMIISGFGDEMTKTWNPGDTIEVDLTQNDRGYWNFQPNAESKPSENPMHRLLKAILVELRIMNGKSAEATAAEFGGTVVVGVASTGAPAGEEEIKVEDIPF